MDEIKAAKEAAAARRREYQRRQDEAAAVEEGESAWDSLAAYQRFAKRMGARAPASGTARRTLDRLPAVFASDVPRRTSRRGPLSTRGRPTSGKAPDLSGTQAASERNPHQEPRRAPADFSQ